MLLQRRYQWPVLPYSNRSTTTGFIPLARRLGIRGAKFQAWPIRASSLPANAFLQMLGDITINGLALTDYSTLVAAGRVAASFVGCVFELNIVTCAVID